MTAVKANADFVSAITGINKADHPALSESEIQKGREISGLAPASSAERLISGKPSHSFVTRCRSPRFVLAMKL
jgi:hypothetical protein